MFSFKLCEANTYRFINILFLSSDMQQKEISKKREQLNTSTLKLSLDKPVSNIGLRPKIYLIFLILIFKINFKDKTTKRKKKP